MRSRGAGGQGAGEQRRKTPNSARAKRPATANSTQHSQCPMPQSLKERCLMANQV
jgi:hypothetical protein